MKAGQPTSIDRAPIPSLTTTAILLTHLARAYPKAIRRIDDIARQPWPTDTLGGAVSGGDHSDPTLSTLTAIEALLSRADEMRACATTIIDEVNRLARLERSIPNVGTDAAAIASAQRCTGGMGLQGHDEWGDERCEEIYERSYGHNAGLCVKHIRARNRWEQKQRDVAC